MLVRAVFQAKFGKAGEFVAATPESSIVIRLLFSVPLQPCVGP
jgi:hypothetical protein